MMAWYRYLQCVCVSTKLQGILRQWHGFLLSIGGGQEITWSLCVCLPELVFGSKPGAKNMMDLTAHVRGHLTTSRWSVSQFHLAVVNQIFIM